MLAGERFFNRYKDILPSHELKRRTLVVRNTWTELRDTTLKSFFDWFGSSGTWKATEKKFTFPNGHEFFFYGLDRPKDVRKVKSLEITDFILDEAIEIEQEIFMALMGRKGRFPAIKDKATRGIELEACGVLASNPPEDEHWIVEEFDLRPKVGYHAFYQPGGMDPGAENLENLPPGYYNTLLDQYEARPDLIQRYVHGKRSVIVRGKPVYGKLFQRDLLGMDWHVTNEMPVYPKGAKILGGWDNSGNVPAAVVGWMTPNGRLEIVKEFTTDRSGIIEFGERVVEHRQLEYPDAVSIDVADPAGHATFSHPEGGLTSNAMLLAQKVGVELLRGIQSFPIRREGIAQRLVKMVDNGPALRIYGPGCPRLVAGLEGGYAYPKLPDNRGYGTEPVKNKYTHPVEGLQYLERYLSGHVVSDEDDDVQAMLPTGGMH